MLKYAKIINEETKQVQVGTGSNINFYKSIGFKLMDVEEGADNNWYIIGNAPIKSLEEVKEEKNKELKQKRDEYKKDSGFNTFVFENLEFNLIENVNEEKEKWEKFLKDLIKKYDTFKNEIKKAKTIKELEKIKIKFED